LAQNGNGRGNNRRKQQGTVQETVREEIRVALNVKGKHREDIATLFNYPVGNRTVSPEAIEEMIAMGFAGVQLDFTAGVQNLDEDALRKIRELNPDAIILFVPPADPAEKMQLQKVLASARLAATPVEPFRLGSLLAGIPENGNIGLRVYAEPDDAADDPEDIQQMESQLNDVIDSNARYVILPFGAHAGIVNANHLALREMVERLISRRVDSTKNIELREERAFRGGAAMARTLPVNVEELRTMLDLIPAGIAIAHDREGANITVSPRFARLLGISNMQNASSTGHARDELPYRCMRNGVEIPGDELPMQVAGMHDLLYRAIVL
jgi:PAS domain-containing protein